MYSIQVRVNGFALIPAIGRLTDVTVRRATYEEALYDVLDMLLPKDVVDTVRSMMAERTPLPDLSLIAHPDNLIGRRATVRVEDEERDA